MKIGISSYDFSKPIKEGRMTLFDAISFAAQTGYDAIEFTDLVPPEGEDTASYARRIRDACAEKGIEISAYAVWADFINSFGGDIGRETERVERCVDIAGILGAKLMRHDATWGFKEYSVGRRSWRDAIRIAAPAIREVTEYAQERGIRTMCENHGTFMQGCQRVEELVNAVGHENFGWLVDMGNFLCADERPEESVAVAAPYAFHVHAKDFLWKPCTLPCPQGWFDTRSGNHLRGTILDHGVVPVGRCIETLKQAGYDGTVALEFEGMEDPKEAARLGYEFLRRACGKDPA